MEKFILLPHYESFRSDSILGQKPTLYEYVLVENPSKNQEALAKAFTTYAQQLKRRLPQQAVPYDYIVRYYEYTAKTSFYKHQERDPNTLSHTYLQDNTEAFLGAYSALNCSGKTGGQLVKVTVKDAMNRQGMPIIRETILLDSCE